MVMPRDRKNKLSALEPGDELYEGMPLHVQEVYRRAKAFRRQQDRRAFAERMDSRPAGLRTADSDL